jgi:methanol--5-hydroxybenzimidazolylcobamide Co-methyltransferase
MNGVRAAIDLPRPMETNSMAEAPGAQSGSTGLAASAESTGAAGAGLAYAGWEEMVFGRARYPVRCGFGLEIGAGRVHPEIKYHPRPGTEQTFDTLRAEYERMGRDALDRAIKVGLPALVIELEHVFQLTANTQWGREVTHLTKWLLKEYHDRYGLQGALRATIADVRKAEHGMRGTAEYQLLLDGFAAAAGAGADVLAIESTGGKEVFNHALTRQDLEGAIFAVGVLGARDMRLLWPQIVEIAAANQVIPGGDTACAHANTAMFLGGGFADAEVSHVFAALVRAVAAARSWIAFDCGALGPSKDCGYEHAIVKAITGRPISMEGKTSACAHSDMMGNLAAAVCDLWSNEAVEYGELFGGTTPAVFTEILGYDVALMNAALARGQEHLLRDLLVASDEYRDPQAFILAPCQAFAIAAELVKGRTDYERAVRAARAAFELIQAAAHDGLPLSPAEQTALTRCGRSLDGLPDDEDALIARCVPRFERAVADFRPAGYGL